MDIEIVGALAIMAVAAAVGLTTRLAATSQRRITPEPAELSSADRRLLPYLKLTPAQWLSLTDFQRANLRERAHRTMS
ncbi:hypothetical protein [Arthrobacter sp.]|uniref:hypothetical protein n=1 Tax=Arthrobacter sp. TaxID=1667 RepID=UPI002810BBFE|nr:hypothetical protein [Arthrobacter sp.]